jgi:hypothetical protein
VAPGLVAEAAMQNHLPLKTAVVISVVLSAWYGLPWKAIGQLLAGLLP